jgi:hypothetical protein
MFTRGYSSAKWQRLRGKIMRRIGIGVFSFKERRFCEKNPSKYVALIYRNEVSIRCINPFFEFFKGRIWQPMVEPLMQIQTNSEICGFQNMASPLKSLFDINRQNSGRYFWITPPRTIHPSPIRPRKPGLVLDLLIWLRGWEWWEANIKTIWVFHNQNTKHASILSNDCIPSGKLTVGYWKLSFIVHFPIKNCDFP